MAEEGPREEAGARSGPGSEAGRPDGNRWDEVRELFDRAADLDREERRALLDDQTLDPEVRAEVESLLAALEAEEDFLETPAGHLIDQTDPASSENLAGSRVGAYVLRRLVGSGGMGVVYEADRADEQYRQRVAIKLMRRGVHSELILERFRRERQILAGLDHPGIARLIDGGVTENGQPYYVMEYIDGVPITEYCRRRTLGLEARLRLFREVCEAVHFAHRNLVVHRDLKPGNILVTAEGRVKLLDFGIAKLLPTGPGEEQTLTQAAGRMLTPAYASPEQVQGEPVTTASDVYSLGVVLYQLLTGRKPFEMDGPSLAEAVESMVAQEPTRPSDAVTDATAPRLGHAETRKIRRSLEGELDNIVLMALRKDPTRRYASASQLSEDIERFLTGRPVTAQRDTAGYRIRKFMARHRSGVAAAALVLLSLVGGLVATMVQAARAERNRELAEARFADARGLANALLFDVHDAIEGLPGSTPAREMIVTRGLDYLDRLAEQARDDPDIQHEVAEAYLRLGLVQGTPAGASLGQVSHAETSLRRALEISGGLVEADASDDSARRTLALANEQLGDVLAYRGEVEEGVEHARRALGLWSYFAESRPDDPRARLSAVISHVKLGDLLGNPNFNNLGDATAAIGEYEYARNLLRHEVFEGTDDPGVLRYRGLVAERLATMLRREGRQDEALGALREALAIRTSLASDERGDMLRDVAVTHHQICGVHTSRDDLEAALAACEKMLALYRRLHESDPANAQAVRDLALGYEMMHLVHSERGRSAEALAALDDAIELRASLIERAPDDLVNRRDWARAVLERCAAAPGPPGALPEATCEEARSELVTLRESGVTTPEDEELLRTS